METGRAVALPQIHDGQFASNSLTSSMIDLAPSPRVQVMFMHDAIKSGAAVLSHRAWAVMALTVGTSNLLDVVHLARPFAHARWRDRLPAAGGVLPRDGADGCRSLSAQRPARSLQACSGALEPYRGCERDSGGLWDSIPQRSELELAHL